MAIERAILHMGMTKTGSASIQDTLINNTSTLGKNGFRYLSEWGRYHLTRFKYLFSPCLVNPIGSGHLGKPFPNRKQYNKNSIQKMLNVMNTSECKTLIFSGEYSAELWHDSTIDNIKDFIDKYFQSRGIETTIIFFVRNPLTWAISSLQQQIFAKGYLNKDSDYFETEIKHYQGIINLQKHFSDSLKLIKFEDACLDENGLVGCFLKASGFPENELKTITIYRTNESRSLEAMEFINYVETVEPRFPYSDYKRVNPNRYPKDLLCLKYTKGVKFDLPYESKAELWGRFSETVHILKKNTGIDYTNYTPPPREIQEMYSEQTVQEFIELFPKLSFVLQKHFLKFFEKKYMETAQIKFKQLHFKDSTPWKIYNSKNAFFSLLSLRIKNRLRNIRGTITKSLALQK